MSFELELSDEERRLVRVAVLSLAEGVAEQRPAGPVDMRLILDVAARVVQDAPPMVLAGIITLILSPFTGETNDEYAARLRRAVGG
jgi:hypothetical protein